VAQAARFTAMPAIRSNTVADSFSLSLPNGTSSFLGVPFLFG
jgi:hypothetical protein